MDIRCGVVRLSSFFFFVFAFWFFCSIFKQTVLYIYRWMNVDAVDCKFLLLLNKLHCAAWKNAPVECECRCFIFRIPLAGASTQKRPIERKRHNGKMYWLHYFLTMNIHINYIFMYIFLFCSTIYHLIVCIVFLYLLFVSLCVFVCLCVCSFFYSIISISGIAFLSDSKNKISVKL